MKPIIGIVECYKFEYYKYAIEKHGGEVKLLLIGSKDSIPEIDGLLLPGGGDIDPEIYDEGHHPKTQYVNKYRDEFEISLFNEAIEKDIPVFGICRGIQIINVTLGGGLYQDIKDCYPQPACKHDGSPDDWHDITIESESLLMEIVGTSESNVNSAHHQAIDDIGESLIVTAHSKEDGIIEAVEYPAKPFVIAVQYHPERMWKDKTKPLHKREFLEHSTKLFEAFINAATERRLSC